MSIFNEIPIALIRLEWLKRKYHRASTGFQVQIKFEEAAGGGGGDFDLYIISSSRWLTNCNCLRHSSVYVVFFSNHNDVWFMGKPCLIRLTQERKYPFFSLSLSLSRLCLKFYLGGTGLGSIWSNNLISVLLTEYKETVNKVLPIFRLTFIHVWCIVEYEIDRLHWYKLSPSGSGLCFFFKPP